MTNKMSETIENHCKIILACRKKFPNNFLTIDYFKIGKGLYPIGIFKCRKCEKPILHNQFDWSTLCSSCDLGKDSPKWDIKKPLKYRIVDRLTENG